MRGDLDERDEIFLLICASFFSLKKLEKIEYRTSRASDDEVSYQDGECFPIIEIGV